MSIGNSLVRARYRLIPDQAIGDLLSKPWIETAIPTVLLLLIAAVLGVLSPGLFEPGNLSDTGRQWGEVGLLALGMMVVVLCGGIDLSVGSIYGLATFATVAALTATRCLHFLHERFCRALARRQRAQSFERVLEFGLV